MFTYFAGSSESKTLPAKAEIFPEEFDRQVDTYLDLEVLKATANYINMKGQDE